jgi:hypothetical protein
MSQQDQPITDMAKSYRMVTGITTRARPKVKRLRRFNDQLPPWRLWGLVEAQQHAGVVDGYWRTQILRGRAGKAIPRAWTGGRRSFIMVHDYNDLWRLEPISFRLDCKRWLQNQQELLNWFEDGTPLMSMIRTLEDAGALGDHQVPLSSHGRNCWLATIETRLALTKPSVPFTGWVEVE